MATNFNMKSVIYDAFLYKMFSGEAHFNTNNELRVCIVPINGYSLDTAEKDAENLDIHWTNGLDQYMVTSGPDPVSPKYINLQLYLDKITLPSEDSQGLAAGTYRNLSIAIDTSEGKPIWTGLTTTVNAILFYFEKHSYKKTGKKIVVEENVLYDTPIACYFLDNPKTLNNDNLEVGDLELLSFCYGRV